MSETQLQKLASQTDYILLDGSGSMATKWNDTLAAVDAYISGVRAENINSQVYLHIFSGTTQEDICGFNAHISDWAPIAGRLEGPFGGTHLYDAVGIMALRMRELDPERASIIIVTDGDTGGDRFTDLDQAKAYLDWMRAKGWTVTFIGADFSNAHQARMLGADASNSCGVSQARLTDAASSLAKKRAAYGRGATEDINFTKDEQQQFGGYLAAPEAK